VRVGEDGYGVRRHVVQRDDIPRCLKECAESLGCRLGNKETQDDVTYLV
jgi:hypothetical protein